MSRDDLFISDLHLDERCQRTQAALLRFLKLHAARAGRLFILGDLFNAWIGRKQLDEPYVRQLAAALRELSAAGVEVHFVAGNRDFFSLGHLAARTGMTTHAAGFAVESFGQRVWVCHGHDLLRRDRHTHQAQSITHARPVEFLFEHILPHRLARFLANGYQRHSSRVVRHKSHRTLSISDAVLLEFFDAGHQAIVCGHLHRLSHQSCRILPPAADSPSTAPAPPARIGHLYTLGAWHQGPHYLRHGPDGWHFHSLGNE